MLWLAWFLYCVGLAPTWCFVYLSLRPARSTGRAWLTASGAAVIWPLWMLQFRRWQRKRSWVDEVEAELHRLTP